MPYRAYLSQIGTIWHKLAYKIKERTSVMNESTGYTENREDEDPAVSAFDKQHDNDMLPNVPEDEDSQTETVPDATNLPAHPIRSPSPTFPPEDTPDDTLYNDIFREQRQPEEQKLPDPLIGEAKHQAAPEKLPWDSPQLLDSIQQLEKLCANLQDSLTAYQAFTTTLNETDAILAETLHTLSAETQAMTTNRQAYEKIMTEMSRTAHWLEHTNKRYTEMMAAMPIQAEKAYTGMIQKHAANYQNLMIKLGKLIETKVLKPPKATNYYAIAGILIAQTIALYVLLK